MAEQSDLLQEATRLVEYRSGSRRTSGTDAINTRRPSQNEGDDGH